MDAKHFQHSLPVLLPELKKCVVTCHNCHGEVHAGLRSEQSVLKSHAFFQAQLTSLDGKDWSDFRLAFGDEVAPPVGVEPT